MRLVDFSNQWRDTLSSSGDSIYWHLQRHYKILNIVLWHYDECNQKTDSMKVLTLENHFVLSRSYGENTKMVRHFLEKFIYNRV